MLLPFGPSLRLDSFVVADFSGHYDSSDHFMVAVREALQLLQTTDPRRYNRVVWEILRLKLRKQAMYMRFGMACLLDATKLLLQHDDLVRA